MSHSHKFDTTKGVGTALSFLQCMHIHNTIILHTLCLLVMKNWEISQLNIEDWTTMMYVSNVPKKNVKFAVKDDIVLDQFKHVVSVSGETSIIVQKSTESVEESEGLNNNRDVPSIQSDGFYYLTLLDCTEVKQDHLRDSREVASAIEQRGTTDTLLAKIDIGELSLVHGSIHSIIFYVFNS